MRLACIVLSRAEVHAKIERDSVFPNPSTPPARFVFQFCASVHPVKPVTTAEQ